MKKKYFLLLTTFLFSFLGLSNNNPHLIISPSDTPCNYVYADQDQDGYFSMIKVCKETLDLATQYQYTIGNDCDDTDYENYPGAILYKDMDGDHYGDLSLTITAACESRFGYVTENGDCNDQNALLNPDTYWYQDHDGDGFGSNAMPYISNPQCIQPQGYVLDHTDCNDNNATAHVTENWFADTDGDSYGSGVPTSFCGTPISGYVNNNFDLCPNVSGPYEGCQIPNSSVVYEGGTKNYIITTIPKIPVSNTQNITNSNDAIVNITYFDGLGRPIQEIASKQSGTGNNLITPIEYDDFGRQIKEYLPYATTNSGIDYVSTAITDQSNFSQYSAQNPYIQKFFEASPLNRVLKQAAPGASWIGHYTDDDDHTIKFDYQTNDPNEVKMYGADATWNGTIGLYTISLVDNGFYDPKQLYKTITKNENWTTNDLVNNTTEEFKDKQGRVILKRTYNNNDPHETYYVYDIYGNLTYVIPPKVDTSIAITDDVLKNLCYQYRYDYRNRLVEKRIPGKQWEYIVYDKLDRVVATAPAFSPFGDGNTGWIITKYDAFSRVAYSAWLQQNGTFDSGIRYAYQKDFNNNNFIKLYETKTGSNTDNIQNGYSSDITPKDGYKLLTINYYDDYSFTNAPSTIPTTVLGQDVINNTKGMPTGSWVRVLTAPDETFSDVSYQLYDKKARVIGSYTTNYLGGYTNIENNYNFAGQVLQTVTKHQKSDGIEPVTITEDLQYTLQGRLLNHIHQINNRPKELMAHNTYDELGKLISKNVGGSDITNFTGLQQVDYGYNIRGWLKNINDVNNLNGSNGPTDLFAFKINYDDNVTETVNGQVNPLYNGNISETYWRTASDNTLRKYGYQYDNLNRLLGSFYQKPQAPVALTDSYDENLKYDKNGNITHLNRTGGLDSQTQAINIDQLDYSYPDNSNQLSKVTDGTNDPQGFKDDSATDPTDANDDYVYDANGNMTIDYNKGINKIIYNHLNLPIEIDFDGGNKILYLYDATGKKARKNVVVNNEETITDYLDGFQYKNNELQFFATAEGYVNISHTKYQNGIFEHEAEVLNNQYSYVYNYVDHLGNIRLSYGKDPINGALRIIEENHYYPFGLKHTNYNSDKWIYVKENAALKIKLSPNNIKTGFNYKYNGKELQDELGLNLYDYGARNYDPAIGRWMNIDPLSEESRRWSPYTYAMNNPVYFIDVDGMYADANGNERNDEVVYGHGHWSDEIRGVVKGGNEGEKPAWGSQKGIYIHQQANSMGLSSSKTSFMKMTLKMKGKQNKTAVYDDFGESVNRGTEYADTDQFQTGEYSYRHAMRDEDETIDEAKTKADKFVRAQFLKAKNLLVEGDIKGAGFYFGIGLHTLQDATSPAHNGFQVWTGEESIFQQALHVEQEMNYPGANSNLQKITNQYFKWLFGEKSTLPSQNLLDNIKHD